DVDAMGDRKIFIAMAKLYGGSSIINMFSEGTFFLAYFLTKWTRFQHIFVLIIALYPIMSYMDVNQNHYPVESENLMQITEMKGIILSGKKILHTMLEIFNVQGDEEYKLQLCCIQNIFQVSTKLPKSNIHIIENSIHIDTAISWILWLGNWLQGLEESK
ncbi:hypothetical protein ACJX0J_041198, partial [Zea mays]